MMSDLNVYDFATTITLTAVVIGLLIHRTRPSKPISMRTRHKINQTIAKKEARR